MADPVGITVACAEHRLRLIHSSDLIRIGSGNLPVGPTIQKRVNIDRLLRPLILN